MSDYIPQPGFGAQASPAPSTGDPLEDYYRRQQVSQIRTDIMAAPSPDAMANATRMARQLGSLPSDVEALTTQAERSIRAQRMAQVAQQHPPIGAWAAQNPRGAVAASDDHEALGILGGAWDFLKNVPGRLESGLYAAASGAREILDPIAKAGNYVNYPFDAAITTIAQSMGLLPGYDPGRALASKNAEIDRGRAQLRTEQKRLEQASQARTWVGNAALGAVEFAPAGIAGALTGNPYVAAGLPAALIAGSSYRDAREQGLSRTAALNYATATGATAAITGALPASTLVGALATRAPFAKTLVNVLGQQVLTQQVQQHVQDLTDWLYLHPEKTAADYLQERPEAAMNALVGAVVGAATTVGGAHVVDRALDLGASALVRGARNKVVIDAVERAARESKFRARDPIGFADLSEHVANDAGVETVTVAPEAIRAYQQSDGYDAFKDPFAPYEGQIAQAEATGGEVDLPKRFALGELPATPAFDAIKDHLRINGEMTPAEVTSYSEKERPRAEAEMQAYAKRAGEIDDFTKSRDAVQQQIFDQLEATNRFSPQVNKVNAELAAHSIAAMAERTGMTPEAFFADHGFSVGDGAGAVPSYDQAEGYSGQRHVPVTRNADMPVPTLDITTDHEFTHAEAKQAFTDRVRRAEAKLLTGEAVDFNQFRKAAFSKSDRFDQSLRYALIGHMPEIVAHAVPYGESVEDASPGHTFVHAVARVDLNGEPIAVRLVLKDVGEGKLRQYQIEGFEAVAAPESMLRPNGLGKRAPETATTTVVRDVVENFKGKQLFQNDGAARGAYTPPDNKIHLLKDANLSTFIHELGHYHLETLAKFADAHDAIGSDFDTVLRWFKPDLTRAQWAALGMEERRPFHEQFARGHEAYLLEGNAPSRALRSVFQRASAWLKSIYQTVRGLGVELTPEVRQVMDRLVAAPREIQGAEIRQGYRPAFEAKPEGMADSQWEEYQALGLQATVDATEQLANRTMRDLQWFENAKAKALKEIQKDNAAKRQEVRDEVTKEVMAQPVERAREFIRFSRIEGDRVEGPHKIALSEMKAMYPLAPELWFRDNFGYGKYGMLAENGIHPEQLAEMFGYPSARQMIEDLRTAPTAKQKIADLTDQRMLERHGDINDPRAMAEAALEAVHNDARAKLLATEFRMLEKALGRKSDIEQAAKDAAQKIVSDMPVGDLNPSRFWDQERRAGREVDDAMRKGDLETAAAKKRAQVLQFHLAKAVAEARDVARKQVAYLKGFDKKARRERIGTDIELIDQLLADFDLRASPNSNASARQEALKQWMTSAAGAGYEPLVDERLTVDAPKRSYTEISSAELTGLHDTVKSIAHVAREKATIMADGRKIATAKAVEDLMAPMIARGEKFSRAELVEPPTIAQDGMLPVALHKLASNLRAAFHGELEGQDFKANRYDLHQVDGPFGRYIFGPLNDRAYWKVDRTHELTTAFRAMGDELGADWQGRLQETVPNTELIDPETGELKRLTRGEMLRMATHVGNESNFRKLADGWGWDAGAVWRFLKANMTAKDWKAAQFIMDQFEPLWGETEAMTRRLGGVVPEKVPARPFTVETPDGETVHMHGGYSPIDYDPKRSRLAQDRGALDLSRSQAVDPNKANYRATTTSNGALKNRIEGYTDVVNLGWEGIARSFRDTIHDLAYREVLINANKILSDRTFKRQFEQTFGPEEYLALRRFLENVRDTNRRDDAMSRFERFMQYTRAGVIINGIGYRLSTVAKHGTSAALKSLGYVSGGGGKYFAARAARSGTGNLIADIQEAREKFPEIRARLLRMDRDFGTKEGALLERETWREKNERYGHAMVAWSDLITAQATAHAAYDWAVSEGIPTSLGGTGKPMDHEDAVRYANKVVREAHGSALETTRSNFMHDRGVASLFGTIYGFMNNSLGQMMDMTDKGLHSAFSKPVLAARLTATMIAPAVMTAWLAGGLPGQDESPLAWMAEAIAGEVAGTVPIVRDAWKAIENYAHYGKVDFGDIPTFQAIGNLIEIPIDVAKELDGKSTRIIQHAFDALGQWGHIAGAGQAGHMLQYERDVQAGKKHPDTALAHAKGLLIGGREKKRE